MSRLIINRLVYRIETHDNLNYGSDTKFKAGLNIVFGPNSVGKTSIITGLIYGLGAEKGLGIFKSIQNPFKPEFYKSIDGHHIKKSYLLLEISNRNETITIFRYIKGGDINICAVKRCEIDDFAITNNSERYIVVGDGVFTENGFQNFIYNFLSYPQVEVPTYDQKVSKLYFENLLPLFFVEQRAGWSQIQARQVTRYNLKDVKKVSFEYLFGLDSFYLHLAELELKDIETRLKSLVDDLSKKEENLMIIANAEKIDGILIVNTNQIGKTSIYDFIRYLKDKYQAESVFINDLTSENKDYENSNLNLRDSLKRLNSEYRRVGERIDKISVEIGAYENYVARIQTNKYKNKQLKKIQEISNELNINTCPVCESRLQPANTHECILCHSDLSNKLSTPDQNLAFLEDEEGTFKKVISQRLIERRKLIEQRNGINDQISSYESQLEHQTATFAGKEFDQLRQRILSVDSTHKDFEKFSRIAARWEDLGSLRMQVESTQNDLRNKKEEIEKYNQTEDDKKILQTILKFLKSDVDLLGLFKGNKDLISGIKLDSTDNYTPFLDDFDIYNISSSSDNIRIILSYYLSLLQTSLELKSLGKIKFPDLLIFDEPKQQNLDSDSLIDCIGVIENFATDAVQIILTTYSDLPSDKSRFQKYIVHEMKDKNDYLLKPLS